MTSIAFTPDIDPQKREEILDTLSDIERKEDVRVLFAIESGSRAWGFPSPDSDYDARFVYVRPIDWYLSLTPGRDVIELPIDDLLDVNGWDLQKALNLLLKPNAVLVEWLKSPIRYRWDEAACAKLLELASKVKLHPAGAFHYFNLGESLWKRHIVNEREVKLKKYFYIVRPALALQWLRLHPDTTPPMNFQELLAGVNPPDEVVDALRAMLEAKAKTKEIGLAARIPAIDAFIEAEFELTRERLKIASIEAAQKAQRAALREEADAVFRALVRGA